MGDFQGLGDLASDGEGFVQWDWAFGDAVLERRAFDVFEDQGGRVAGLFQAVNGGDVRMVEGRQHLRFTLEAGQPLGVVDEGVGEDLQRDIAVEFGVTGLVHFARAACADGGEDFVGAEGGAYLKSHCWERLSIALTRSPQTESIGP